MRQKLHFLSLCCVAFILGSFHFFRLLPIFLRFLDAVEIIRYVRAFFLLLLFLILCRLLLRSFLVYLFDTLLRAILFFGSYLRQFFSEREQQTCTKPHMRKRFWVFVNVYWMWSFCYCYVHHTPGWASANASTLNHYLGVYAWDARIFSCIKKLCSCVWVCVCVCDNFWLLISIYPICLFSHTNEQSCCLPYFTFDFERVNKSSRWENVASFWVGKIMCVCLFFFFYLCYCCSLVGPSLDFTHEENIVCAQYIHAKKNYVCLQHTQHSTSECE